VDVERAARRWAEVWARGWSEHEADGIVELYADDARFRSAPFRDDHAGKHGVRDYVEWAFADEDSVECWFGEPVSGNDRAAVEYWAVISSGGQDETLAGIAVLRFDEDGLVSEQRDYWSMQQGRREPATGWGA